VAAGFPDKEAFVAYAIARPETRIHRTVLTRLQAGYGVSTSGMPS
jgi:hypothetical protein